MPPRQAIEIVRQLLSAVASLHDRGIIHRDIKPSNVVRVGGVWKLADIGLLAEEATEVTAVGTPGFMPPTGPMDRTADLYALGKLLYCLVTGNPARSFPALPGPLLRDESRRAHSEVNDVVTHACGAKTVERFPTAVAFADALDACLEEIDAGGVKTRQRSRQRKLAVAFGAALLATGIYLGGEMMKRAALSAIGVVAVLSPRPSAGQCEVAKLIGSDASTGDQIQAVGIDGDFVVIGAPRDDETHQDGGAAYVFHRTGSSSWVEVSKLRPRDPAHLQLFGAHVGIDGDLIVANAPLDHELGGEAGAAYVFQRGWDGPDAWGQVKKLVAADGQAGDHFGLRVALSGDTAIAGAHEHDIDGMQAVGAAYVFVRDHGGMNNWGQVKRLTAPDGQAVDAFGWWVSISRDTAAVGALLDDDAGTDSGSVYVFERNSGGEENWGLSKKITASDASAHALFGHTVSITGDLLIVGAIHIYDPLDSPGAAYVFSRNEGGPENWGLVARLAASDGFDGNEFGRGVAINEEVAVVSASRDNVVDAGAVYLFARDEGGPDAWGQVAKITPSDLQSNDKFGHWLALDGGTAVIASYLDDNERGSEAGSAYVFAVAGDCDQNGSVDLCQVLGDPALDVNENGILDACEVIEVVIDIKPGSDPNSVNLGSHGVIPVAILTTQDFDATTVDPDTVELAGATVAIRGNGSRTLAFEEDVDGDGDLDLVLQVETENLNLQAGATEAVLTGETYDGEAVRGSDLVNIVAE
jgi:hypothetical protein